MSESPRPDPAAAFHEAEFSPADCSPARGARPRPGLPEAVFWTVGVFAAQVTALLLMIATLVVIRASAGQSIDPEAILLNIDPRTLMLLAGGQQVICLTLVLSVVVWRFGRRMPRLFAMRGMSPLHSALIVLLVLPLLVLGTQMRSLAAGAWESLRSVAGLPPEAVGTDVHSFLSEFAWAAPLPLLLVAFAVAPAFSEELVFRGVLGRGLVARWGAVGGVLLTSLLFAAAHTHPVHAVSVIPLGIALHYVYLTVRSLWGPILLHFLNNAWALLVLRRTQNVDEVLADPSVVTPALTFGAVACTIAIGLLLWQTRRRYQHADGTDWTPGWTSVEVPPPESGAVEVAPALLRRTLVLNGLSLTVFVAAVWVCGSAAAR